MRSRIGLPDSFNHTLQESASLNRENCCPHESDEATDAAILSEGNTCHNWIDTHQMIGIDPYMPKILRTMTGKGTA